MGHEGQTDWAWRPTGWPDAGGDFGYRQFAWLLPPGLHCDWHGIRLVFYGGRLAGHARSANPINDTGTIRLFPFFFFRTSLSLL